MTDFRSKSSHERGGGDGAFSPHFFGSLFFFFCVCACLKFYFAACASGTFPGVYSRISGAASWIQEQVCQLSDVDPSFCANLTSSAPTPVPAPSSPTPANPEPSPTTPKPTRRPTPRRPTIQKTRRPSASLTNGTTVTYRVEVKYDKYPRGFAWKIRIPSNGAIVMHYPPNRITTPYKLLVQRVTLKIGRRYRLVLKDWYRSGMKRGYVKLYRGNKLVQFVKGTSIGALKKIDFVAS